MSDYKLSSLVRSEALKLAEAHLCALDGAVSRLLYCAQDSESKVVWELVELHFRQYKFTRSTQLLASRPIKDSLCVIIDVDEW